MAHNSALQFTFAFSSPVIPSDTFQHMIFRQDLYLLLGCFYCPTYVSNFLQSQTILPEEFSIVITSEPRCSYCPVNSLKEILGYVSPAGLCSLAVLHVLLIASFGTQYETHFLDMKFVLLLG